MSKSEINIQIDKLTKSHDKDKYFNEIKKAAEDGHIDVQHNLATLYYNGEGTEKNLEKAFYWYQKTAENGNMNAQYNLALLYENGEKTEKNLEKAFYWYEKAADNDYEPAMISLALCYKDGNGTGKNLKKAFYWYQKAIANTQSNPKLKLISKEMDDYSNKMEKLIKPMKRFIIESEDEIYNICNECHMRRRPLKENHQVCIICYQAKLLYKPSGSKIIDEFIKYTQINFIQQSSRMKFIPSDQFKDIKEIGKGGFSKIYKATWISGPPYWNEEKEDFEYKDPDIMVALKQLNNTENITFKELREVGILYCIILFNKYRFLKLKFIILLI